MPEVESTGRPKRFFDILLWGEDWSRDNARDLDDIEVLREYLRSLRPSPCAIRVLVPDTSASTTALLNALNIRFTPVATVTAGAGTLEHIPERSAADAVETALTHDADAIVVSDMTLLVFIEEADKLGIQLCDTGFVQRQCELFVGGHDVPWSFSSQVWGLTWTGFHQVSEPQTFSKGMDFLYAAQEKNANADARETGRSLVYNRLNNLCFTRDRLLFYEIQRLAATRAKWKRQEFKFEIAYYLNFYYPLIYGAFDHAALLVSQTLGLGLGDKNVGATYKGFLDALKAKNGQIHAILTEPKTTEFLKHIGSLRHYAAHRGSLTPTKILQAPEHEPTTEELDCAIADAGLDEILKFLPAGKMRESFRETLRFNFKMAAYEKGEVIDGVVPVEIDGKFGFIRPAADTTWNFARTRTFLDRIFVELTNTL